MAESNELKRCSSCGVVKPRSEFHQRRASADGLNYVCKPCVLAKVSAWQAEHPERVRASRRRRYRENREGRRAAQRAAYAKNAERERERNRRWAEANRDYFKNWRAENAEYMAAHYRAKRAARAAAPVGPVDLPALWTGFCGICNDPLSLTARFPDPMSKSIDHIVPLSKGGAHEQSNLQWAHLMCNLRKGARLLD